MAKLATLLALVLFAAACGKSPSEKLTSLSEDFVYASLAFSPSSATAAGLHQYQKQNLDDMLDDFSAENLSRQRTFYEKFRDRLAALNTANLTAEDRADLAILQDQIALNLLDLTEIHSHLHSPQLYVETLGNALFAPYVLEYAPKPDRIRNIIARLQKVPLYPRSGLHEPDRLTRPMDPGGHRRESGQYQRSWTRKSAPASPPTCPTPTPAPPVPPWTP